MKRRVLLAVVGTSPQVLTETLYALYQQQQWWPDDLLILTTTRGRDLLVKSLITEGRLQALSEALGAPTLPWRDSMIEVIPDSDGTPAEDARSAADQRALADFILERVRQLTTDEHTEIHASLAGGRKTMTYYLGYSMSLHGRTQDRLSHVLVPAHVERTDVYFPTADTPFDITLSDVPFIRLRYLLAGSLPDTDPSLPPNPFHELVEKVNLAQSAESHRLQLHIAPSALTVTVSDTLERIQPASISLSPLAFALYQLVAEASCDSTATAPVKRPFKSSEALEMLRRCVSVLEKEKTDTETDDQLTLAAKLESLQARYQAQPLTKKTVDALGRNGIDYKRFDTLLNEIRAAMATAFPQPLLPLLTPGQYGVDGRKARTSNYRLALPPTQIHWRQTGS